MRIKVSEDEYKRALADWKKRSEKMDDIKNRIPLHLNLSRIMKKTCHKCGKKRIGLVCAKIGCKEFICKECAPKIAASVSVSDDSGCILTLAFPMCEPCKTSFEGGIGDDTYKEATPEVNEDRLKHYLMSQVKHRDLYAGLATLFKLPPYTYH